MTVLRRIHAVLMRSFCIQENCSTWEVAEWRGKAALRRT
nr:MAG TPA: hypothetical protein [Caudoviricetes sp.]